MAHTYTISNLDDSVKYQVTVEHPTVCPICHKSIYPIYVSGQIEGNSTVAITYLCRACNRAFITRYLLLGYPGNTFIKTSFIESLPVCYKGKEFSPRINDLCQSFSTIYNQSSHAEQLGLTEICGLGYRKAIEHLVKAYHHRIYPDLKLPSKTPLGTYINQIDDDNIKSLAFAAKEIGNGEAHVVQETDYDIDDMKEFIEGLVYFVDYKLLVLEAKDKFPRKNQT